MVGDFVLKRAVVLEVPHIREGRRKRKQSQNSDCNNWLGQFHGLTEHGGVWLLSRLLVLGSR